jgi:predicted ArsR family transcriptional regulator
MASNWTFLSNHGNVLLCIADNPRVRLRDIAGSVGITERAVHRIISDLVADGYVSRDREGRRNRYEISEDAPLRHPLTREKVAVRDLLSALNGKGNDKAR